MAPCVSAPRRQGLKRRLTEDEDADPIAVEIAKLDSARKDQLVAEARPDAPRVPGAPDARRAAASWPTRRRDAWPAQPCRERRGEASAPPSPGAPARDPLSPRPRPTGAPISRGSAPSLVVASRNSARRTCRSTRRRSAQQSPVSKRPQLGSRTARTSESPAPSLRPRIGSLGSVAARAPLRVRVCDAFAKGPARPPPGELSDAQDVHFPRTTSRQSPVWGHPKGFYLLRSAPHHAFCKVCCPVSACGKQPTDRSGWALGGVKDYRGGNTLGA